MRRSLPLLSATLGLAIATSASAQDRVDVQFFHPMPAQQGNYLGISSGQSLSSGQWEVGLLAHHAAKSLVVREAASGDEVGSVVKHQTTANLLFGVGFLKRIDLQFDLPLYAFQSGDGFPVPPALAEPNVPFGIGDPRVIPKVNLFDTARKHGDHGVAMALLADFFLPLGDDEVYQGDGFRVHPRAALDVGFKREHRLGFNVGYSVRPEANLLNLGIDDMLTWGAAAHIRLHEHVRLVPELEGAVSLLNPPVRLRESPAEGRLAVRLPVFDGFMAQVGGGTALFRGFSAPQWRVFAGISYTRKPNKQATPVAVPPPVPVPRTFEVEPECVRLRMNGRVYFDFDKDTIQHGSLPVLDDLAEQLRSQPDITLTLVSGHTDWIGSLTYNEDLSDRRAASVRRYLVSKGIDAGRIETEGFGERRPIATNKSDEGRQINRRVEVSILETSPGVDVCPMEEEDLPECTHVELEGAVYFHFDKDTIQTRSLPVLQALVRKLKDNPQVRLLLVEGHTDWVGSNAYNLDLSHRRAASVRRYLIASGIAPERIESEGFGESRPVATNQSAEGRQLNRRVEVVVLQQDPCQDMGGAQ